MRGFHELEFITAHNALSEAEACAKIMITVEQVRAEKAAAGLN